MAPDDPELAGLGVAAVPVEPDVPVDPVLGSAEAVLDEPVEPELVVPELVAAAFWVVVGELAA
jgi:hypothetical protein